MREEVAPKLQNCSCKQEMASTNMTMANMPTNAQPPMQQPVSLPVQPQVWYTDLFILKGCVSTRSLSSALVQKTHEEHHRSNKASASESHTESGPRQPGESASPDSKKKDTPF